MPFFYELRPGSNFVYMEGAGVSTLAERQIIVADLLNDTNARSYQNLLIDVSKIYNVPSTSDVDGIVQLLKLLQQCFVGRIAIVNSQVGHASVSRLVAYLADHEPPRMRAFTDSVEAEAWLTDKQGVS